jgi:hypothetical protein
MRSTTAAAATAVRGLDVLSLYASGMHALNENPEWNHRGALGSVPASATKSQPVDSSVEHSEWREFPLASFVEVDDDGG